MSTVEVHAGWVPDVTVGLRLRAIRREIGRRRAATVTQKAMAGFLEVGEKRYGSWEADEHRPSVDMLAAIADKVGCDRDWLTHGGADREEPNLQIKNLVLWPVELAAPGESNPPPHQGSLFDDLGLAA